MIFIYFYMNQMNEWKDAWNKEKSDGLQNQMKHFKLLWRDYWFIGNDSALENKSPLKIFYNCSICFHFVLILKRFDLKHQPPELNLMCVNLWYLLNVHCLTLPSLQAELSLLWSSQSYFLLIWNTLVKVPSSW